MGHPNKGIRLDGVIRWRSGGATTAPVQVEIPPSTNVSCVASFNDTVIEDFRANAGVLGGKYSEI